MSLLKEIFGFIVEPVTTLGKAHIERKRNKESLSAKLAIAKQSDNASLDLTDGEWEAFSKMQENGTWKDEFVTVTFMLPIWLIFLGAIHGSYKVDAEGNPDGRLLEGTLAGIEALTKLGLNWGEITFAVVLAAIGLKLWRAGK